MTVKVADFVKDPQRVLAMGAWASFPIERLQSAVTGATLAGGCVAIAIRGRADHDRGCGSATLWPDGLQCNGDAEPVRWLARAPAR
jgi:hypothetical protein